MSHNDCLRHVGILRCPVTREKLTPLSDSELASENQAFLLQKRVHYDGTPVELPLEAAIGTASRSHVYRVSEEIFWLLTDLALVRRVGTGNTLLSGDKRIVQSFYDEFGWVKTGEGHYNDTVVFTDIREVAALYQRSCNARVAKFLSGGAFLLDVASGAIPLPEYVDFSRNFETRVCVDFSIRALREARVKLGSRGLYLLGDITRLPLASDVMDATISLHTIYHVPQPEQTSAVDEVVRVTKPGGRAIIVYTWSSSGLMNNVSRLRKGWKLIRNIVTPRSAVAPPPRPEAEFKLPPIYFKPQGHDWFLHSIKSRYKARLVVWSAVSTAFQILFFKDNGVGRTISMLVRAMERSLPWMSGRYGQYPMIVIDKVD